MHSLWGLKGFLTEAPTSTLDMRLRISDGWGVHASESNRDYNTSIVTLRHSFLFENWLTMRVPAWQRLERR